MATSESDVMKLKHLGFVKMLAINSVIVVWKMYGYVKQKSGPLKSTVEKVEHAVTAVVGPVYHEFQEVPNDILVFLDNLVDEASYIFDKHAPSTAKSVASKALTMVKKASFLVQEAKVESPVATISQIGEISSEAFDVRARPITENVASMLKKASDLVPDAITESPIAAISHAAKIPKEAIDGHTEPIAKSVTPIFKKATDLVPGAITESPVAVISHAGKISKKASDLFDERAPPIAKGLLSKGQSMANKASDLVHEAKVEGPIAAVALAGKISKEAFDKHAPPIAKNALSMVNKASDLAHVAITEGPFAAVSQARKLSMEFAARQLIMVMYKAIQYSFVHGVLEVVIAMAAYLLDKYNSIVKYIRGKGWFSLFSYVPLVPVEEMKKAYTEAQAEACNKSW